MNYCIGKAAINARVRLCSAAVPAAVVRASRPHCPGQGCRHCQSARKLFKSYTPRGTL